MVFVTIVFLAAAFSQVEGDANGADDWRPLSTMVRPIPLLVALSCLDPFPIDIPFVFFSPLETVAASAICAAAPFSVFMIESGVATGALCFVICADIAALPILPPILPLASVHPLVVVREEE